MTASGTRDDACRELRVTKHHHACVFVEDDATRLLIDPGQFGTPPPLDDVDGVLVTHEHFDHLDPAVIAAAQDRAIPVWLPADARRQCGSSAHLHDAVPGETFTIGTLSVSVGADRHAAVHPELPGCLNRSYTIAGCVLITGDAHPDPGGRVAALVTPIDAPWLRAVDLIRYVRTVRPDWVLGIHDGLLNDIGRAVAASVAASLTAEGAARAAVLADGQTVSITSS